MMTDREYAELVADIKAHGLIEPITRYQGKIFDGRNRFNASNEAGIEPTYIDFDGDDDAALAFVISKNLMRRQPTTSQRAMVSARHAKLKKGQRKSDASIDASQEEAAKLMNVSRISTQRARKVLDKGDRELIAAVDRGEIKVSKAAKQIDEAAPIGRAATNGKAGTRKPDGSEHDNSDEIAPPTRTENPLTKLENIAERRKRPDKPEIDNHAEPEETREEQIAAEIFSAANPREIQRSLESDRSDHAGSVLGGSFPPNGFLGLCPRSGGDITGLGNRQV